MLKDPKRELMTHKHVLTHCERAYKICKHKNGMKNISIQNLIEEVIFYYNLNFVILFKVFAFLF